MLLAMSILRSFMSSWRESLYKWLTTIAVNNAHFGGHFAMPGEIDR
jgi:hypothetical protein